MDTLSLISPASAGRLSHRQRALDEIRLAGPVGRADLARKLDLSVQAASNITADLMEAGLIRQSGKRTGGRGMPVALYELNPDGAFALGFEVRPTSVYATIADMAGQICAREKTGLAKSCPDTVLPELCRLAQHLTAGQGAEGRIIGAGIVRPGPFGRTGLRQPETELSGWEDPGLHGQIEGLLGMSVTLDNDATAGACAEHQIGSAQNVDDFAYLYFGAGLGLGVIAGGQPLQGAFGNSGEIGHVCVQGFDGVLEDCLSRKALEQFLQSIGLNGVDVARIEQHFDTGALTPWITMAAPVLGQTVALIENLFDPAKIVLGGAMPSGVLEALIAACPLPSRTVSNRCDRVQPRLQCGACGPFTVSTGAAALMRNRFFTTQP
ncbi:ROK family protein [Halovulum sp. GXIMD14793]